MPVLCQEYVLQGSGSSTHKKRGRWGGSVEANCFCVLSRLSLGAYTVGGGQAYAFDNVMSSTGRHALKKPFQECGPRFFDMSAGNLVLPTFN